MCIERTNLDVKKNGEVVGSLRWTPDSIRQGWLMRRLARRGYFGVDVWFGTQEHRRGWYAQVSGNIRNMFLGRNIRQARVAIDAMDDRTATAPELANA